MNKHGPSSPFPVKAVAETNRIGSPCWYQPAAFDIGIWRAGVLHAWSTDYDDDNERGSVMYPVAVIEDVETGNCSSVYVTRVSFSETMPSE